MSPRLCCQGSRSRIYFWDGLRIALAGRLTRTPRIGVTSRDPFWRWLEIEKEKQRVRARDIAIRRDEIRVTLESVL